MPVPPAEKGSKGQKGELGEQGPQGQTGSQGRAGVAGPKGDRGPVGAVGQQGVQGFIGAPGATGAPGARGSQGECDKLRGHPGPPGPIGPVGPPGETLTLLPAIFGAGSIFVRWGRTNCPDTKGTKALYYGRAAGSSYNQRGGTSDMLCLPEIPEYGDFYRKGVQGQSTVVGAEYETFASEPLANVANDNVPCAVCHVMPRNSIVTMPARLTCPDDWTTEYRGYLMTSHAERYRQSAVCVDEYPEGVCGEEDNTGGALLYHMVAGENGLDSPPYSKHEELSCVVCTK